jgi:hypothetical protein
MRRNYLLLLSFLIAFTSCEDTIDVEPEDADSILVVDAWITNKSETQKINLSLSQPYFLSQTITGVEDAKVGVISNNNTVKEFRYHNNGAYIWSPAPGESIGEVGDTLSLIIERNGEIYQGSSVLNPVPSIDSIVIEFKTDEFGYEDGLHAELMARDLVGLGDTYWIKTFKNNSYLNKPEEINITFDGGIDGGAMVDGIVFIPPIRELINPFPDDFGNGEDSPPPYVYGDSIRVEIHSITLEAFQFMNIVKDQLLNGYNTIFSIPLSNTISNVVNVNGDSKILGFFNVSAVESKEMLIQE